FALQLLGLFLAIVSLSQPRWGYTFQDVKRKGLDLLIAVDTSRSMLSNDVQPNRLERVKLVTQDLINELQGDRVGLIAFAGRAFLQAPLTIDYDAVVEAINDLDTKTIPEGGTNMSSAIALATQSFGKSATGNRALIIFTDGEATDREEFSGDDVKTAKEAADAGVRIFAVGVVTPKGSLIPVAGDDGQTAFVKDSAGQVHKSKLDDKRLREIAQATGGFYVHLESGLRTMQQLQNEGLAKMKAAEMDVRLSRQPIERYEWPLSAGLIALALSILIPERKRARERRSVPAPARTAAHGVGGGPVRTVGATVVLLILLSSFAFAAAPGIDAYHEGKFEDAYSQFQQTLKSHPQSSADDKLHFDSGAAAYKLKDYNKALESFSQALLTRDTGLQSKGHYNLGNTLYQHGEAEKSDEKKLSDWTNALDHYEQTLKLDPQNKDAQDNYDYVKRKIEELKNKKSQQQPSPSPSPPQKNKQQQPSESPSPSPGAEKQQANQPSPSPGQRQAEESPSPGEGENEAPSPPPGEGEDENSTPSASPSESPQKKFAGDVKGAGGEDKSQKPPDKNAQVAEAESEKEGQMSERQALALLESMKDEEARVQLDERRVKRHVYNDW